MNVFQSVAKRQRRRRCNMNLIFLLGILFFAVTHVIVLVRFQSTKAQANPVLKAVLIEQKGKDPISNGITRPAATDDSVHIVFSTDCSGYQHWQGIVLYYSAVRAKHNGPVTRIASSCDEKQKQSIRDEWRRIDPTGSHLRVHFTPSFSLGNRYKYSNKPGGLRHWLQNANPEIEENVICLLDPDMVLMRPITATLGKGLKAKTKQSKLVEYLSSDGVARLLRASSLSDDLPDQIRTGHPAGQHFGIGSAWVQTPNARPSWSNFSKAHVCGQHSPCTNTSKNEAYQHYSVGPVYIASKQDWDSISRNWWDFVPRVHQQYPLLLAEMYAYTMAVADLRLPFSLLSSYMVSDPTTQSPTEAWSWIDDIASKTTAQAVCMGANATIFPLATRASSGSKNAFADIALPNTLHYCQRYHFADHLFAKHRIPHDFFRCDAQPLPLDVNSILTALQQNPTAVNTRTAFMLCHLIPMLNLALESYKQSVCQNLV